MPLSERERRILEEIERNLYQEDPSFAGGLGKRRRTSPASRRKLGALLFFAGLAVLIGFFVTRNILVGVAAFGAMVSGMVLVAGSIAAAGADGEERSETPATSLGHALHRLVTTLRRRRKRP